MREAVISRADGMDLVVMAAAVADYAPADRLPEKLTKGSETITLVLQRTPDILGELGRRRAVAGAGPLLVGFAAETSDIVARAAANMWAVAVWMTVSKRYRAKSSFTS